MPYGRLPVTGAQVPDGSLSAADIALSEGKTIVGNAQGRAEETDLPQPPAGGLPDPATGSIGQVAKIVDGGEGNPAWGIGDDAGGADLPDMSEHEGEFLRAGPCVAEGETHWAGIFAVPGISEPDEGRVLIARFNDGSTFAEWSDAPSGGGADLPSMDGHEGEFLRAGPCTADGEMHWDGIPNAVPGIDEYSDGRVLTARYNGGEPFTEWSDAPGSLPDPGNEDRRFLSANCGELSWEGVGEGLPGYGEAGDGSVLRVHDDCGQRSVYWGGISELPEPPDGWGCGDNAGKVLTLDSSGNATWATLP